MKPKPTFLSDSLRQLQALTVSTYSPESAHIANVLWEKHLQTDNPLWQFVTAKPFFVKTTNDSAHVIAIIDNRLSKLGIVGYFACSDSRVGAEVLNQATSWLKGQHGVKDVYGPINGTATSDYRLNLDDDYCFPGEPVNPLFHIDAFREAGFLDFNHYVSGNAKHYKLLSKLFIRPPKSHKGISIRPFDISNQLRDLKFFHELMITIFPGQSIYCPTLSWEERVYNFRDKDPMFNPRYTYFLEDHNRTVGVIVAFSYKNVLIIKTIGVLPEYRGRHLSSLLTRKVHDVAAEDELGSVIYAMVRVGNAVYGMKKPGVKVMRRYMTMKKSL